MPAGMSRGPRIQIEAAREAGEVDRDHIEHRQRQYEEEQRDPGVEPGRRVDGPEGARGEDDNEAEDTVHGGHRRPVGGSEEEAAPA